MNVLKNHWIVLLICVMSIVSFSLYVLKTEQYPVWDEHHYLSLALDQYNILKQEGLLGIPQLFSMSTHRQPLYSLFITVILLIVGTAHTYKIALGINGLLYLGAIIGTYALSRQYFSKTSSQLAAFLYATYGNVLFYSHFTYTETATTAFVIWSLFAVAKTQGFSRRNLSITAGLLCGLAVLTRWIAPVFIIGGIFIESIKLLQISIIQLKTKKQKSPASGNLIRYYMINLGLFTVCAAGISIFFYFLLNYQPFLTYVSNNQRYGSDWVATYRDPAMANTSSIRSIMYYFNILQQNTVVVFSIFVAGMLTILYTLMNLAIIRLRRSLTSVESSTVFAYLFLLASCIIPYAFLTFITIWKEDRFIVPLYPIIAIISVSFIEHFRFSLLKKALIVVVIGVSLLNAMGSMWGIGPMGTRGLVDYITPKWVPHPRRLYLTPLVWPPTKDQTHAELFISTITNHWQETQRPAQILITVPFEPLVNAITARSMYEIPHAIQIVKEPPADIIIHSQTEELKDYPVNIGTIHIEAIGETVKVSGKK